MIRSTASGLVDEGPKRARMHGPQRSREAVAFYAGGRGESLLDVATRSMFAAQADPTVVAVGLGLRPEDGA